MVRFILLLSSVFFINTADCTSKEITGNQYFPLQTGNSWVYQYSVGISGTEQGRGLYKITIGPAQLINGKNYFQLLVNRIQIMGSEYCSNRLLYPNSFIRVDTLSGTIYRSGGCSIGDEGLTDSLSARKNDTIRICETNQYNVVCADTNIETVLGLTKKTKNFVRQTFSTYSTMKYAADIGLISSSYSESMYSCLITLKGCSLNGILYGDTSTVIGITQISSEVPLGYILFPNYPNPFNPVTKIRFHLPESGFTELTVFDVTGKAVQTLLSEKLNTGIYECDFDASMFSSGVYYYRITAAGFTDVKKMVLIK